MSVLEDRNLRYCDDPLDDANWCNKCGCHYGWHPECKEHENKEMANHIFIPKKRDFQAIFCECSIRVGVTLIDPVEFLKLPEKCPKCGKELVFRHFEEIQTIGYSAVPWRSGGWLE